MLYYEIDTKYYSAPKPTKTIFKVIGSTLTYMSQMTVAYIRFVYNEVFWKLSQIT